MKLSVLSFLTSTFLILTACNSKQEKDLEGFYLDEYKIELLEVKKKNETTYILANHSSELEMQRSGDILKGLVKATGNKDTIFFKFMSQDSVIHELWNNQTQYFRVDSTKAEEIKSKRIEAVNKRKKVVQKTVVPAKQDSLSTSVPASTTKAKAKASPISSPKK